MTSKLKINQHITMIFKRINRKHKPLTPINNRKFPNKKITKSQRILNDYNRHVMRHFNKH